MKIGTTELLIILAVVVIVFTYTDPETDPHVWEKRKRIPQRNGRCGSKGERECRQRGRLSTQRPRSRRAR